MHVLSRHSPQEPDSLRFHFRSYLPLIPLNLRLLNIIIVHMSHLTTPLYNIWLCRHLAISRWVSYLFQYYVLGKNDKLVLCLIFINVQIYIYSRVDSTRFTSQDFAMWNIFGKAIVNVPNVRSWR